MKLFKFILLYLFLISSVQADTIYQLIKIPNLEIYNIKTANNLRYLYAKQPFTIGIDNNINCYNSSKADLEQKYKIIEKNFDKGLNSYEIKVFRQLREKYDLSLESNENKNGEETELSDEAKVTLERIKKGEVFKF